MAYLFHVHVQNDMDEPIHGLNLGSVWRDLEPGQADVVSLDSGTFIEFECNDADRRHVAQRFSAAVTAAGGTPGDVWWAEVGSLPVEE
jgi:hypothetical protein